MRFDPDQIETLLTIAEERTFEAAARRLQLTPSAVSQRIRALERAAGQVLLSRTTPCTVTAAGEPLVRLGRQLRLLTAEATSALGDAKIVDLAVAVNADSLATWFRPVLDAVAARAAVPPSSPAPPSTPASPASLASPDPAPPQISLLLHVEDQAYSGDLLRRGEVLAAVTSDPTPVQGCAVEPLGRLRYLPAAAPALLERHRHGRRLDWSAMPMVTFNEKDHLQDDALAARGATRPPVVHRVPSTADFHEAVCRGLGWGMILEPHLGPDISAGRLARIPGTGPVDVPLFWQRWRLESPALATLTEDVRRAARALR